MSLEGPRDTPELSEERKNELRRKLGSLLHDDWRAPRKKEDGSYEPRVKVLVRTEDGKEKWRDADKVPPGATELDRQDIANTSFEELRPAWQYENGAAGEVAMNEVLQAVENGQVLEAAFVEKAGAAVHDKWLERNSWVKDPVHGNPAQAVPYGELSEEEKEKDRKQVRKAIELYEALY